MAGPSRAPERTPRGPPARPPPRRSRPPPTGFLRSGCHGFLPMLATCHGAAVLAISGRAFVGFSIDVQGVEHHNPGQRAAVAGQAFFASISRPTCWISWFGWVPEWLKGTDCKSVGLAYVGSNPTPSTNPDFGNGSLI